MAGWLACVVPTWRCLIVEVNKASTDAIDGKKKIQNEAILLLCIPHHVSIPVSVIPLDAQMIGLKAECRRR